MKNRLLLLSLAAILSLSVMGRDVNGTAPDFSVDLLNGGSFKLSDNANKVVLIFFFGNTCPSCISVGPSVQSKLINSFSSNEDFVAIAIDTWDGNSGSVSTFKLQTGLTVPMGTSGSKVAKDFGSTFDRLIVIDKNGDIKHRSSNNASGDIATVKEAITKALNDDTGGGDGGDGGTSATENPTINDGLSYYPNPASERLNVALNFETPGDVEVAVIDATGRQIYQQREYYVPGSSILKEVNVSKYPSGIYFLKIDFQNERVVRKIAVQ